MRLYSVQQDHLVFIPAPVRDQEALRETHFGLLPYQTRAPLNNPDKNNSPAKAFNADMRGNGEYRWVTEVFLEVGIPHS